MDTLGRISRGDETALGELLHEAWEPLVLYLQTILPFPDQAKDAAQEAFVRMWAQRDRWTPGSARGLLFHLGRNAALDLVRKDKVRSRFARDRARENPDYAASPEDDLVASEFAGRFRIAMQELPEKRREVFELVRFRGLSYKEVATAMEISYQTVANQMTLAHKDLRRLLGDLLNDSEVGNDSDLERRSRDG